MYLEDALFYPALIWAIEKYTKTYHPYAYTDLYEGIEHHLWNIHSMCRWRDTENGWDYWANLHNHFLSIYGVTFYFPLMMKDYKAHFDIQLHFDFGGSI